MNKIFKILFVSGILFTLFYTHSYAQQNHFLYIQADDKQTFSVNVNGKTYNSSDIGYVIVPKLTDGKYQLNVSFPENKYPDQQFNCVINKNDAGYALKNYKEKGWGLFNLQTLDVTMAGTEVPEAPKDTTNPNAFGEMLSDVMRDTTLKNAAIELQQAEKEKQVAEQNPPSVIVVPTLNDSLLNAQKQDSNAALSKTSVMKIAEHTTNTGTNMVFVDASTGDTIKVFLPKEPQTEVAKEQKTEDKTTADTTTSDSNVDTSASAVAQVNNIDSTATANNNAADSNVVDSSASVQTTPDSNTVAEKQPEQEVKNENVNPAPETLPANNNNSQPNNPFYKKDKTADTTSNVTAADNETSSQKISPSSSATFKQDCKQMLEDKDLEKVKKKMVSSNTDDKMIQTAKKYIEDKCVTTDQVKSLGLLFLTDDGRYNFFDAMYKNVYDISAFSSLQSQLIDPYYKKRFQAMLK
jgi:hypothetical protein